eukprot:CAMPEP_0197248090 /NCGR_PEP_ID=MMETSP1429-20130617/33031_1 /TAXON_ID=49237 /ORGANISM="Chaetoceros  sp., Strain UNC1202" /LENGTH=31 /DNA_ID= /DNA_START= /DNA_END= /DNA_ORIENTATION=
MTFFTIARVLEGAYNLSGDSSKSSGGIDLAN